MTYRFLFSMIIACLLSTSDTFPKGNPSFGTLVISIPTKTGLMIASDRLAVGLTRNFDIEKIVLCEKFTAIASTGMSIISGPQDFNLGSDADFNATLLTKRLLLQRQKENSFSSYLPKLATAVSSAFCQASQMSDRVSEARKNNRFLFQTIIFHYDHLHANYETYCIIYRLTDFKSGDVQWEITSAPKSYFEYSTAVPAGSCEALLEISKREITSIKNGRAFIIKKYLNLGQNTKISSQDALDVVREMFQATFDFEQNNNRHPIGTTFDAIEISPKGTRWICRKLSVIRTIR